MAEFSANRDRVLEGSFECHGCGANVTGGRWDMSKNKLRWSCENCGYLSEIDFKL